MDASPLAAERFPPGTGPFGARGVLVGGIVEYVRHRAPGGVEAVLATLDGATRTFFDGTLFLASAVYDLSPVVSFCSAAAASLGETTADFVRQRAETSAKISIESLYKRQLSATDPTGMAARLPKIFQRFFDPCRAEGLEAGAGRMRVRFGGLPKPMLGFYAWSCEGFVPGALRVAGARDVHYAWSRPAAAGTASEVELVDLEFSLTWG